MADGSVKRLTGKEERKYDIEQEINKELGKEQNDFYLKPWCEHTLKNILLHPIPEWFIQCFQQAVLAVPPGALELKSDAIVRMAAATPENISFADVGSIGNALNRSEPRAFSGNSFNQYTERRAFLDKTTFVINEISKEFEQELWEKKTLRMKLAMADGYKKAPGSMILVP